jgi:two-component system phosphate regulon sensor histidine kinase PhoR
MTKRIFGSTMVVAMAVFLACLALIMAVLYEYFGTQLKTELKSEAAYIAQGIANDGIDYFDGLNSRNRITWVAADGDVLYDSSADAAAMESHADRDEIQEALDSGTGEATRYSNTLSRKTIYYAQLLPDGTVLRISGTQHSLVVLLLGLLQPILVVLAVAVLLSALLASRLAKRIVRPINEIDPAKPEEAEVYPELSPLLSKIYVQNQVIARQMNELKRRQQEFSMITENMSEGFLVIDKRTDVLSYNTSAIRLLGADESAVGKSVFTLNRGESFRRAVDAALAGQHCELELQADSRCYQLLANPVHGDAGEVAGAVIMLLDVTERHKRESLRREFTANVSHELKTPLTSISGTAELIRNGLVKSEDIPHFAGNIYKEATRLSTLVADIIKLSQLDENAVPDQMETVDLYELSKSVLTRLEGEAEKKTVSTELHGEHVKVTGVLRILDEMLYNLCDNAIKYNRPSGRVKVTVMQDGGQAVFKVADTGIGIPPDQQERVFERFYRVDKSHSKEIGGTGLGLSIVKHGAAYLGAAVGLSSIPDEGTVVTLTFRMK